MSVHMGFWPIAKDAVIICVLSVCKHNWWWVAGSFAWLNTRYDSTNVGRGGRLHTFFIAMVDINIMINIMM